MSLSEPQIQRAFRAVAAGFFVLGWIVPTLFAQFPTIRETLNLKEGHITLFILAMAVGAVPSMLIGSFLISKVGSRVVAFWFFPVFLVLAACFMVVPSYPVFLLVGLGLGISTGFFDVSANSQGSLLEVATDRFFLTAIHALFAAGVLVGSLLATTALFFKVPIALFFVGLCSLSALLMIFIRHDFLPFAFERAYDEAAAERAGGTIPRTARWLLVGLSVLMVLAILAEASNYDWLSQYFSAEFTRAGAPLTEFWFNLPMVFFSSGLLLARVFGDQLGARIGRPRLLLYGTLIGLVGLSWLIYTPVYGQGLGGSFLMGFGFAFFFPIFVAAAGRLNGVRPAFGVALVSAMGWGSVFIGPPLIGFVAQAYDFRWAYATILPIAALVALFGPWVVFKSRPENH